MLLTIIAEFWNNLQPEKVVYLREYLNYCLDNNVSRDTFNFTAIARVWSRNARVGLACSVFEKIHGLDGFNDRRTR